MLIEISGDIFNTEANFKYFNKLLQDITYKRRYEVFIDFEVLNSSKFISRIDSDDLEIIIEYFQKQLTENRAIDYIISETSNDTSFSLEEAIRFFNEPVLIMLENDLNDSYFLNSLINNFKNKSKKIKKNKDEGWLKYNNAGGATNVINTLSAILMSYNDLPKANHTYLKCLVLLDSDKEYPTMNLKPEKIKIIEFCEENGIKYHILNKREMENYLPDELIEKIADEENDNYLHSYLKLNPIQKDYFDLEKGFNHKNLDSFQDEIKELYNNVDNNDYKILRLGMTNEKFLGKSMKSEFPKLFEHPFVNQLFLLNKVQHQDNKNELQDILSKINELL